MSPAVPVSRAAEETTIDIIGGYYQQDGTHGAVEGGRGTQHLTDVPPAIIVNVPLDTVSRLTANVGADFYASASTDRIDFALRTPSAHDVRFHGDFGYSREHKAKGTIWGVGAGVSKEYDYLSFNVSGLVCQNLAGRQPPAQPGRPGFPRPGDADYAHWSCGTALAAADGKGDYGTDTRQTYNFTASYSQVLTKRVQAAISTELVSQNGLLSTPFHRVYFRDNPDPNLAPTLGSDFSARVATAPASKPAPLPLQVPREPAAELLRHRPGADSGLLPLLQRQFRHSGPHLRAGAAGEGDAVFRGVPLLPLPYPDGGHLLRALRCSTPSATPITRPTTTWRPSSANKVGLGLRYSPVYGIRRFHVPGQNAQGRPA